MLTGAVELLAARADTLPGDVLFMFQPGEEGHHGARFMLDDGLIDPVPDAAFALHVMPNAPHGQVQGRAGALMAGADQIEIAVTGAGGHASMPHHAADPIPVACEIVGAIQTMVTRQFDAHDPVVVTIAKITAGSAHNVIPDSAHMKGTMRSLSPPAARLCVKSCPVWPRDRRRPWIKRQGDHPSRLPRDAVRPTRGRSGTGCGGRPVRAGMFHRLPAPIMGAEDFSYVLERAPGAMLFLGAAHEGRCRPCLRYPLPRMVLDEAVLPRGSACWRGRPALSGTGFRPMKPPRILPKTR
jgi:hippurate hydrolase